MRVWRTLRVISEWFPIIATPFAVQALSDNFTHALSPSMSAALIIVVVVNLGWIGLSRFVRQQDEFRRNYPGFRWRKTGG